MPEHKQNTSFIDKPITSSFNESDIIRHSFIETSVEKTIYDHLIEFHQTSSSSSDAMNDQFIETQQRMINVIMIKVVAAATQGQRDSSENQKSSNPQKPAGSETNDNE